jgi:hypothetical protein
LKKLVARYWGVVNTVCSVEPSNQPGPARRQHFVAAVLFAAILVVVFSRAIFFGEVLAPLDLLAKELPWRAMLPQDVKVENFTMGDVLVGFYPWKRFLYDELHAGRFPLWCTYVGCGYPLAGEGMIKLFGLTTAFLSFSTPRVASILTFSSQLFIAMTGMYALLWALRARWSAAVFGALVFGLNSAMFQHLELEYLVGGLMMMPWICWAVWGMVEQPSRRVRWAAVAALFFGLAIIHGSVQGTAMVWFSVVGFTAMAIWQRQRSRFIWRFLTTTIAISMLGAIVGSIALLPNLELIALNTRGRFGSIYWIEMMWKRPLALVPWLACLFNPDVAGNPRTFDLPRGLGRIGLPANQVSMDDVRVYCGLVGVVLAVWGLRVKCVARTLGITLVVVPLFVVLISPMYLMVYFRYLAATAIGIAVLAALGIERLLDGDSRLAGDARKTALVLIAAISLALIVGAAVSAMRGPLTSKAEAIGLRKTTFLKSDVAWQQQKARETVRNFSLSGNAVLRFGALALIVAGLLVTAPRHAAAAALVCVVLNTADLLEVSWRTFPSVPRLFEYPTTPALQFLQRQPGLFRVASRWNLQTEQPTAPPNMLMMHNLADPRVYGALVPKNPLLDAQDWNAVNVRFFIVPPKAKPPREDWQLAYSGEVDIYENPHVQPRVSFVKDPTSASSEPAEIHIEEYVSGHIVVEVVARQAGWLIVRERLYPGWRATVNGRPAELHEAQGLWQAVAVPAGSSRVVLSFRPRLVYAGAAVTILGLLVVAALWWRGRGASARQGGF